MGTLPTFYLEDATVTAREAEVPDASFDNGVNYAASNACGIGINVGVANLAGEAQQFTLLDQRAAARTPQTSQHIGGDGLSLVADYPSSGGNEGTAPDGSIRTAIVSDTGDGSIGAAQENVGLAALTTGWQAPVV